MGLDVVDRLRLAEVSGCWVRRCCAEFLADLLHLDGCDDTVIADVDWWTKPVSIFHIQARGLVLDRVGPVGVSTEPLLQEIHAPND